MDKGTRRCGRVGVALMAGLLALGLGCELGGGGGSGGGGGGAMGPDNDRQMVVCMGDCITGDENYSGVPPYPVNLQQLRPDRNIIIEGGGGADTGDGLSDIGGVLERRKPGQVIIFYGTNDILNSRSRTKAAENIRAMVQAAKAGGAIPITCTLPGTSKGHMNFQGSVNELNALIKQLATEEGVTCVDLGILFDSRRDELIPDERHPGAEGLALIAQAFSGVIQ